MSSLFGDTKTKIDVRARILEIAKSAPEEATEMVEAERPLPKPKVGKVIVGKVIMWPLDVAAQPTELSRCGLFRLLPKAQRRLVNNQEIASRGDMKLIFTGEELNVKDETLWMAILRMCRGKPLGERVYFSMATLLTELKMKDSGGAKKSGKSGKDGSRALVLARLERLSKAHIKVEVTRKSRKAIITTGLMKFGSEEETGTMYVRLDPDGAILFDNLAYQNWETRLALKSDIAARMLDYVSGHQAGKPHAVKIESLRAWFGYGGRIDKFKTAALSGLKELEMAGVIRDVGGDRATLRWTRT